MIKTVDKNNFDELFSIVAALGLALYIFCAHFKYPFVSTDFLYLSFLVTLFLIFVGNKKMQVSRSIVIYILILVVTCVGGIYTNNPESAGRQEMFFGIYFFFFWLAFQKSLFLKKLSRMMYFFAFLGMITVFLQFAFPVAFNAILLKVLRTDVYEAVMWSFNVDGTFTGITSSVSMASFSMTIVFFSTIRKIVDLVFGDQSSCNKLVKKYPAFFKVFYMIVALLALFGIILTSKRGIFVATIIALILTCILDKNITLKKINRQQLLITFIGIVILLIIGAYFITTNGYIISFINRFSGNNITTGRDVFYENAINDFSKGSFITYIFGKGTASAYLINSTGLHNVYLQILYDHGIVGIIIYLCFFITNLRKALKNRYFCSMCMQIVFLVYCMSGNPLYDYYFFIPYLMYVCYKG